MDLLAGLNRDLDYAERIKDRLTIGLLIQAKREGLVASLAEEMNRVAGAGELPDP